MNGMLIFGLVMLAIGLAIRYTARRIQKAFDSTRKAFYDLKKELGRNPTNEEVQRRLGLPSTSAPKKEPCPPHAWITNDQGYLQCTKCGSSPTLKARE